MAAKRGRGRPSRSDHITLRDASALFHAVGLPHSIRTLERMMDAGILSYRVTPGGQRRLYRSGVEEYLASTVDTRGHEA